jgi:hypothetical protein
VDALRLHRSRALRSVGVSDGIAVFVHANKCSTLETVSLCEGNSRTVQAISAAPHLVAPGLSC